MIDDPEKANIFVEKLKRSMPIETRLSQSLVRTLTQQSPDTAIPATCNVIDVLYAGDEGGVVCCLDIGGSEAKAAHFVSITHLSFDRRTPLIREIEVYQRHRIKKLRRQLGRDD